MGTKAWARAALKDWVTRKTAVTRDRMLGAAFVNASADPGKRTCQQASKALLRTVGRSRGAHSSPVIEATEGHIAEAKRRQSGRSVQAVRGQYERTDLRDTDQNVGRRLDPHVEWRDFIACGCLASARRGLVDVVLRDGRAHHGDTRDKEAERDLLDGRELDASGSEERVNDDVAARLCDFSG